MLLLRSFMNDVRTVQKRLKGLLLKRPGFTVALCGPAGIGKTFTVQRLLRETACRNLSVHALTNSSTLARALPKPKKLQAWAERTLEGIDAGEFVEANRVIDLIGSLLTGLAPFVVHLEDVHELNAEQLEFVNELARVVQRLKGVALIVTSRQEAPELFEGVQLEALSNADVTDLLEREAGAKLPLEALAWIESRAAGNPLFTLEFFRFLARQGFVWNNGQQWNWRVPDRDAMPVTVEALIEHALSPVLTDATLSAALLSKSLLPNHCDIEQVAALANLSVPELQIVFQELERCGVLAGTGFAHPLFREVALSNMSTDQKRELSRRAIDVFATDVLLQALFVEDAGLATDQTFAVLKQAAEASNEDVAGLWLRALQHVNPSERQAFTLEVAMRIQGGVTEKAIGLLQQNLHNDPNDLESRYALCDVLAREYRHEEAKVVFEQLSVSERESERGWVIWVQLVDYVEMLRVWNERFAHDRNVNPIVVSEVAYEMNLHSDSETAKALCLRTLERSDLDAAAQIFLTNDLGNTYLGLKEYALAEETYTAVIELMERHQRNQRKSVPLRGRAIVRRSLGRVAEAFSDAEEAYRLTLPAGQTHTLAQAFSTLGELKHEQGQYIEAEELLGQALAIYAQTKATVFNVVVYGNLIILYCDWATPFSELLALKHAYKILEVARSIENRGYLVSALICAALVEVAYGNLNRAFEYLHEVEQLEHTNDPNLQYWTAWTKGRAALRQDQSDQALEHLQQASRIAEEIGHVLEFHKIGLEIAHLRHDLNAARHHLTWFEQNQLGNGINIAHRLFPELNLQTPITAEPIPNTRLEVLGPMQLSNETVRGQKRQALLAVLLESRLTGRNEINKLELIDRLYPDEPEDLALSSLKQAVRGIRGSLGEDVIRTTGNGYALGSVTSDAEDFLSNGDISLWRGAYLDGLDRISEDDSIRENLHLSLLAGTQAILESDPEAALRAGRILMSFDAYNLEHLALCVRALQLRNNHKSLNRLYQEARAQLLEVAEAIPERWQDFLNARAVPTFPH
jgi:tetratricopeptide (TPR) repeat protein